MEVSGSRSGRTTELRSTRQLRDQETESRPDPIKPRADPTDPEFKLPGRRVPVVYYLSRNGQLEHPHFMEVPLSSPHGLLLRDVFSRLNVLRGKGMAAMYSWSCKRSYRNGFVWHDLQEDDVIFPAHGNEYVLKGSELPAGEFPETNEHMPPPLQPPAADRRRRNQSCSSIDLTNIQEYGVPKAQPTADVSTQTDDGRRRRRHPPVDEIEVSVSPPPSDSSSPETLETLMKSEAAKRPAAAAAATAAREDQSTASSNTQKAAKSVLMQLISCGSTSCGAGQGSGMGLISQYKMRVPRGRPKLEDKEFFSGGLVVEHTRKEEIPSLKRSTSYTAGR
ncbi:Domain of unknown function (DUF966 [Striga hermonthica]|uniref:SOSEKI DIX-like domain-containing protein n=1 Tax=Striga hermonthica TaxID=68872 RepID=A0A9N7RTX6_STRHE|nr:Domain of unknown function (DUF966 [Striga hermonthica]